MPESRRDPVTRLTLLLLSIYRNILAYNMLRVCRFFPSCSGYAKEAIERHGALKGLRLTAARLVRCHPFSRGGVDPVK